MNNTLKTSMVLLTLSIALSTGAAQAATTQATVTKKSTSTTTSATQKVFTIAINGSSLKEGGYQHSTDKEPLIPLRAVTEALGFELTWNGTTKSANLINGAIYTTVKAGEDVYTINKMNTKLGTAAQLNGGMLYVPASFVSQVIHQSMIVKGNSIVISSAEQHMSITGVITAINSDDKYPSVQINGVGPEGVILNVGEDTVLENADGTKITLKDLHIGMTIKAEHSMIMTMSLPPQTPTYKITVLDQKVENDLLGTAGTIGEVESDAEGNLSIFIKGTGLDDLSQNQVILGLTDATILVNTNGDAVKSSELVKGVQVIGFYSPMLTRSLPPIGTAAKVVVTAVQK